jgi:DNA repair protein RecO (recombination protein O)
VLHQYDWSETSLIVEIFTRERGRIAVVAKGAKRPTSNFRAVLLPLQRLQVQLSRSAAAEANEIHALRAVELQGWQGGLARGAGALFAAFYVNELLLRLLARDDPHPALLDLYAAALPWLQGHAPAGLQVALRAFELVLLRELGWLPELHLVTQTLQPVLPDACYRLSAELGVVAAVARDDEALAGAALPALEAALGHGGFEPLVHAVEPLARRLRAPLRGLLQYHLDAPTHHGALRTRQVLEGLRRLESR